MAARVWSNFWLSIQHTADNKLAIAYRCSAPMLEKVVAESGLDTGAVADGLVVILEANDTRREEA